jgi:acyl-CoA thioester hydrolase
MNDLLTIRVWVERIGNSSMTFGGEVLKEGEVVALARITYVCVSASNLRPVPLPDVLKEVLVAILREGERQGQLLYVPRDMTEPIDAVNGKYQG